MSEHIEPKVSLPEGLVSEWDTELNGVEIGTVAIENKTKYWWRCPLGADHLWQQTLYLRATAGLGCPFCTNRRLSVTNSLEVLYPEVASEWATDLNEGLEPREVVAFEKRRRWWRCSKNSNHVWAAKTAQRTRQGTRCPECTGRGYKLNLDGSRSTLTPLSEASQDFVQEFDVELNFPLTTRDVHVGSTKLVWWRCSFDLSHVWRAAPSNRTRGKKTGCPHCWKLYSGLLLPHLGGRGVREGTRSLLDADEGMSKEFDLQLNAPLRPEYLAISSNRRVWWRCSKAIDHVWEQSPGSRKNNSSGCPYCAGNRVVRSTSLAVKRPSLAEQWDQLKNGELTAYEISPKSNRKVWWRCKVCDHSRHQSPMSIKSDQCPACRMRLEGNGNSQRGVSRYNETPIGERYPSIAKWIHPTLNGVNPEYLYARNNDKIWWSCPIDPSHVWQTSIQARIGRDRCPFCVGKRVSDVNRLRVAAPELFAMLDEEQDSDVDIELLSVGSTRQKIWLRCPADSRHRWQLTPNAAFSNLKRSNTSGCPYCAGRLIDETNSMLATEPEISKSFHPSLNRGLRDDLNRPLDLSSVSSGSNRVKFWWFCPVAHDHIWQATPHQRRNSGCPACDGKQVSVTNSLATRHPILATQWHPLRNGELNPERVTAASGLRVWWKCNVDPTHEWFARISDRSRKGAGCPHCQIIPRSRLEIILRHELEAIVGGTSSTHKVHVESKRFDCDIVFEQDQLIVEYDGAYWHRTKFHKDVEKTHQLKNGGWSVLRVREEPLELVTELDVRVPIGATIEQVCGATALAVSRYLQRNTDRAVRYALEGQLVELQNAELEIAELLVKKARQRMHKTQKS